MFVHGTRTHVPGGMAAYVRFNCFMCSGVIRAPAILHTHVCFTAIVTLWTPLPPLTLLGLSHCFSDMLILGAAREILRALTRLHSLHPFCKWQA